MLSLGHQVCCYNFSICRVICKDSDLGRPGKHINTDSSVENSLGFSYKLVARSHKDVCRTTCETSMSQRSNGLHTSTAKDGVGATHLGSVQDLRSHTACWSRRRCHDHVFDSSNFRCCDCHHSRSNVSITATRNIATSSLARYDLLTCKDARGQLSLA